MKIHESLTADVIKDACRRRVIGLCNPGFCTRCGLEHGGCEPDAREYKCEACGAAAVYGAEKLLFEIL